MPTSAAQIEANRANSQHSTGPRTPEGKAASAANSTQSGLTSTKIFVRPEEQDAFDTFTVLLLDEFLPRGDFQNLLFDQILHASWNVRRCIELEAAVQNEAISQGLLDALLDDVLSKKLDRIYRYKKMHESAQRKAIAELRKLQNEQAWRALTGAKITESVLVEFPKVAMDTFRAKTLKAKAAGAESCAELQAAIDRSRERWKSIREASRAA